MKAAYVSLMIIRCKERHDQKKVADHGEQKFQRVFCETLKSLSEAKMKSKMQAQHGVKRKIISKNSLNCVSPISTRNEG